MITGTELDREFRNRQKKIKYNIKEERREEKLRQEKRRKHDIVKCNKNHERRVENKKGNKL